MSHTSARALTGLLSALLLTTPTLADDTAADKAKTEAAVPDLAARQAQAQPWPVNKDGVFLPPARDQLPKKEKMRAMVELGRQIFTDTPTHAPDYVGNSMRCVNCHLDEGRLADSAPMWAAWGRYPRYRGKNDAVNSADMRYAGCFRYSMNGKAPEPGSKVLMALEAYSAWLATGVPHGVDVKGVGYPKVKKPSRGYDRTRGKAVYEKKCALCHGDDGQGQKAAGTHVFPPLWGAESYNWGAGMHRINTAAAFIKANMPYGLPDSLSDQEAWDVAAWINSQPRPQDPRFTGDVAETREKFHSKHPGYYGQEVDGRLLGSPDSVAAPAGGRLAQR